MFYNRKAIQKRIILERYKDEDVDPTWYTGSYGDDVEGAERAYYKYHSLHHSQYAPDYGPSDLRDGEIDSIEDSEGQYTNEKGERRGGAYGAAKVAQAKWVEWCGEHYPDKKWEDVAADVVTVYYTELKKKYEKAQARENQLKDRIRSEKGEGRVREIENHDDIWADIGYVRKDGTNFAKEIQHCEQVLAKPKHYVLRSEGLRALGNIEDINVDDLYGNFERKNDQYNQVQKDNWVKWYAMFYFWSPALKLLTGKYKIKLDYLKKLADMDWTDYGMSDEDKANRAALRDEYEQWEKENPTYFGGPRPPAKFNSIIEGNPDGIGSAARKEILRRVPKAWRDSLGMAGELGWNWANFIGNYGKSFLNGGKYAKPQMQEIYDIMVNLRKVGNAFRNRIENDPDEEFKSGKYTTYSGDNLFVQMNNDLEQIWKQSVEKASAKWDEKNPNDAKGVQASRLSGAWRPGMRGIRGRF